VANVTPWLLAQMDAAMVADAKHTEIGAGHMDGPSGAAAVPPASPSSSLSPAAVPFFPRCSPVGRTKRRRWAEDDSEESDDDRPTTYLDAACRPASTVVSPPTDDHLVGTYLDVVRRPAKPQPPSTKVLDCCGAGGGQRRLG
jgi:hypothetical protein